MKMGSSMKGLVWWDIDNQVWDELMTKIGYGISGRARDQIRDPVHGQIEILIEHSVWDQIFDEVNEND